MNTRRLVPAIAICLIGLFLVFLNVGPYPWHTPVVTQKDLIQDVRELKYTLELVLRVPDLIDSPSFSRVACDGLGTFVLVSHDSRRFMIVQTSGDEITQIHVDTLGVEINKPIGSFDLSSDGILYLGEVTTGRLHRYSVHKRSYEDPLKSPLLTNSSICIVETDRVVVTGQYTRKRVHLLDKDGNVLKSLISDILFSDILPAIPVTNDVIRPAPEGFVYVHAATNTITLIDSTFTVRTVVELPDLPGRQFLPLYNRREIVEKNLVNQFKKTPISTYTFLLDAYPLFANQILIAYRVGSKGMEYDLWSFNNPDSPSYQGTLKDLPGLVVATLGGKLILFKDCGDQIELVFLRISEAERPNSPVE
jgi:hypothetical protein